MVPRRKSGLMTPAAASTAAATVISKPAPSFLISAGANFASSPARILIDFLDPLLVAEKVATTEKYKYITIDDIAYELRDGKDGVGGIGANGKLKS